MDAVRTASAMRRCEVSDSHARGLRRALFFKIGDRIAPKGKILVTRCRNLHQQPSLHDTRAVYRRTRQALRLCSDVFVEQASAGIGMQSHGIILQPAARMHRDGGEPVLKVTLVQLSIQQGRAMVDAQICGTVSHHAIERMYQRLHTDMHDVVMNELRGALRIAVLLQSAALLARRWITIQQLPIPTEHGALRCVRQSGQVGLEVRTFTIPKRGDRTDLSIAAIRRWCEGSGVDREAGLAALLRERENRWWRDRYQSRDVISVRPPTRVIVSGAVR